MDKKSKPINFLKECYLQLPKYLKVGLPILIAFTIINICFSLFSKTTNHSPIEPDIDYAFGANFNHQRYLDTKMYEPLAPNLPQNKLSKSISLLKYAPNRLHQGRQGSCVGWACSYAAHTVFYAAGYQRAPNSVAFSPAFAYNQVAGGNCEGAYLKDALDILNTIGNLPLRNFNYDEQTCQILPTSAEIQQAQAFKIAGYYRLSQSIHPSKTSILAIRQHLAQGVPVIAGMQVGGTFLHQMQSRSMWIPTQRDFQKGDFFGHAMAIIGYDDEREGGALQFVNSWGSDWGQQGTTWIRYRDFLLFAEEIYSFYPTGRSAKFSKNKLAGIVQLIDLDTQHPLDLRADSNLVFRTQDSIWATQKLKILTHNSVNCYTYILVENEQKKSKILFPYSKNNAAYFGITGSRLFPNNRLLPLSNQEKSQHFAIIFSKRALNWENINNLVNASRQPTFVEKIRETLKMEEVENVEFKEGKAVEFKCDLDGKNAVVVVLEI